MPPANGKGAVFAVVIVDDDPGFLRAAQLTMRVAGIGPVRAISDSREIMSFLSDAGASVIVLDLIMPHLSGFDLLPRLKQAHPELPIIVLTGLVEADAVVDCMKQGAFDYLVKPVESDRFISCIRGALELRTTLPPSNRDDTRAFRGIVTTHPSMKVVLRYAETAARTGQPVLITGETGTGKELVARALHDLSGCPGAFVPVNIAGLDDTIFSDTLFGHRKGAYTGACQDREGLVARAADGTLFLDEIGDLERRSQIKLLRLLEEKEYNPLGADNPRKTSARIVCATNCDLAGRVSSGIFREDLYYRIRIHHVHVPPLRERMDDLPLLVDHCLEQASRSLGKRKPTPPAE
ncbi:MAG: sigma-54-dependent transcriptional regulator, partial [Deltaproteobacteria bacterium]